MGSVIFESVGLRADIHIAGCPLPDADTEVRAPSAKLPHGKNCTLFLLVAQVHLASHGRLMTYQHNESMIRCMEPFECFEWLGLDFEGTDFLLPIADRWRRDADFAGERCHAEPVLLTEFAKLRCGRLECGRFRRFLEGGFSRGAGLGLRSLVL